MNVLVLYTYIHSRNRTGVTRAKDRLHKTTGFVMLLTARFIRFAVPPPLAVFPLRFDSAAVRRE